MGALTTFEALADGSLSAASVLGLRKQDLDALVEQALRQADHGGVDDALELLRALALVEPSRAVLPLLVGQLEVARGDFDAALVAFAEAARRNDADDGFAADVDLATAEIELRQGRVTQARLRLERVVEIGRPAAQARAALLLGGTV